MVRKLSNYKIYHRKDGRYSCTITYHGNRQFFYGHTKQSVLEKLEKRIEELNQLDQYNAEKAFPTKHMSLNNWANQCLEAYCAGSICGNTYFGYKRIIDLHFGNLGKMPLNTISNLDIQKFIIGLSKINNENGLSQNHLLRIRMFLHMVFEYAVQNNLIYKNPVTGIRIPKTGIKENRALSIEEQARLIDAVKHCNHPVMFCVIVALYTGCRRGEILGLRWKDINFEKKLITIKEQLSRQYVLGELHQHKTVLGLRETKTANSHRTIHIIDPLLEDFKKYKENQIIWKTENGYIHSENDFVFPSNKNTPLGSATFYKYYHQLLSQADLTDVNFHTLRHTFATRCLESGIDLITVSKTLGHSSVKVTGDIYTHITETHQRNVLESLESLYEETRT